MKGILLVSAVMLCCHVLNAQNRIEGKISDEDNSPLAGATIFVSDMNLGSVSDENGIYRLANLPNFKGSKPVQSRKEFRLKF